MSCVKCDVDEKDNEAVTTYVRVGSSNVMIVGCEEHLRQLLELYRKGVHESKSS